MISIVSMYFEYHNSSTSTTDETYIIDDPVCATRCDAQVVGVPMIHDRLSFEGIIYYLGLGVIPIPLRITVP